jgi:pyruvate dehydrogenase E1 component alpha subunit
LNNFYVEIYIMHSAELIIKLYRQMVRIRFCEESLVEFILNGEIRTPCHLCSGQEAVAVGVCSALEKQDYIFGSHRSHGHFLAKGGSLNELVAEIYGKLNGCCRGRGGSMHLIDPTCGMMGSAPIVAGTISMAVGAALASSIRRDMRVAVSFFGDGATNEGGLFESMNVAALRRLPIIFVCENNLYSTHMSIRECRPDKPIYKIARALDMAGEAINGNDVLAVYDAATESVAKCRQGQGPVFLECLTYRMRGHVGPDDNIQGTHTDIRSKAEVAHWLKKDPLNRLEAYIFDNGIGTPEELEVIQHKVQQEIRTAHQFAAAGDWPEESELTHYVFQ